MKLAIPSRGRDLAAPIHSGFGRTRQWLLVDSDTLEYEVHDHSHADDRRGPGVKLASRIAKAGQVEVLLTRKLGENAQAVLDRAGIEIRTGYAGSVRDCVETFRSGRDPASASDDQSEGHRKHGAGHGRAGGHGGGRHGGRHRHRHESGHGKNYGESRGKRHHERSAE